VDFAYSPKVIDLQARLTRFMQVFGGAGFSPDTMLSVLYAQARFPLIRIV